MVLEITITKGVIEQAPSEEPVQTNRTAKADFEPNILDDYDSYTYHFRLYMMGEEAIRSGNFGAASRAQRVVIAESAVSSIEIDNVTISSIAGISKEAGIGAATNFSMQLRQPLGATLLDEIFRGANSLGIKNFRTVPIFLELSFRAQNPDRTAGGTVPGFEQDSLLSINTGGDDQLSDVVWVWPIFLTNMAIDVSSGGSVYNLEASIYSDLAYTNQAADLEKQTKIAASTVKEFFVGLENELNKKEEQKTETGTQNRFADTYQFFIDNRILNSKIISEIAEDIANRAAEFDVEVADKNEFVFQPGVSIDRIIENILSTTEFFQREGKGTDDKNAVSEDGQGEKAAIQTLYRVITDTRLDRYDPNKGDYTRIYRYMIIPYELTTIQTRSNSRANLTNQQRYNLVKNRGRIRKAYNYIYTGLNDQVLDFDLTFNFNWYAALPFQAGITDPSAHEPNAGPAVIDDVGNARPKDRNTDEFNSDDNADEDSFGLGEFVDDVTQFVRSDVGGATVDGIATGSFDQLTGRTSQFLASEISRGVRVTTRNRNAPVDRAQQNLREVDPLLEDVTGDEAEVNPIANITYVESMPGIDQDFSAGYSSTQGKTLLTTMFEQAKSPVSADLLNINLQIKGDPFWLEPAPIGRNDKFQTVFDRQLALYNVAVDPRGGVSEIEGSLEAEITSNNSTANQTYMLFRSFTPQNFDPETGLTPGFTDNNVLNGVYAVRRVEHSFSGGQFTQSLQAIRDPQLSLKDVDLGLGVADTRALVEQFNIENIIDPTNTPTVVDEIQELSKSNPGVAPGGVSNNRGNA